MTRSTPIGTVTCFRTRPSASLVRRKTRPTLSCDDSAICRRPPRKTLQLTCRQNEAGDHRSRKTCHRHTPGGASSRDSPERKIIFGWWSTQNITVIRICKSMYMIIHVNSIVVHSLLRSLFRCIMNQVSSYRGKYYYKYCTSFTLFSNVYCI